VKKGGLDDEVGELVDPIDDEEEREDADPDQERRAHLLGDVAIEDAGHARPL
jgi:hypothetical protein